MAFPVNLTWWQLRRSRSHDSVSGQLLEALFVANSTTVGPPRSRLERIQQDSSWHPELGVYFLPLEGLKHQFPKASC